MLLPQVEAGRWLWQRRQRSCSCQLFSKLGMVRCQHSVTWRCGFQVLWCITPCTGEYE